MYGQKQIFQCLAVAILLATLNFFRATFQHNREIQKYKLKRLEDLRAGRLQIKLIPSNIFDLQFSQTIHNINFEIDYCCDNDCFNFKYDHVVRQQCSVDCCQKETKSNMRIIQNSFSEKVNNSVLDGEKSISRRFGKLNKIIEISTKKEKVKKTKKRKEPPMDDPDGDLVSKPFEIDANRFQDIQVESPIQDIRKKLSKIKNQDSTDNSMWKCMLIICSPL